MLTATTVYITRWSTEF